MKIKYKNMLFHYTSMEVLFKLFESVKKPEDPIKLWVSRADFMNDLYENDWLFELMIGLQTVDDPQYKENRNRIRTEQYYQKFNSSIPFVASFTEEHDDLYMWNLYGHNGHGVSIGFNSSVLNNKKGWKMKECQYLAREELQNLPLYKDIMTLCEQHSDTSESAMSAVFQTLQDISNESGLTEEIKQQREDIIEKKIIYKCPDFKPENEHRLIYRGNELEIKHRLRNSIIIPYVELEIPASAVEMIFIGPTATQPERTMKSLKSFLHGKTKAHTHLLLHQSSIPYSNE